ncbi:hypothetical protein ACF0H5_008816 [Mactra antiquata]
MKMNVLLQLVAVVCLFDVNAGQCPHECFCLDGYVICAGLKTLPSAFPVDTRSITFNEIKVDEVPAGLFEDLLELQRLEFNLGSIGSINTGAFSNLMYVDSIRLANVKIGTIASGAFRNITDVGEIVIVTSDIKNIETKAFSDMFALDEMKIFSSSIDKIETLAFDAIDDLLKFTFGSNMVGVMEKIAFSNLINILELDMSSNTFYELGCGSIEPLLYHTEEISLFQNSVSCSCDLLWIKNTPGLSDHFMTNWCYSTTSGEYEKINWKDISPRKLGCKESRIYECSLPLLKDNSIDLLDTDTELGSESNNPAVFNNKEQETTTLSSYSLTERQDTTTPSPYSLTERPFTSIFDSEVTQLTEKQFSDSAYSSRRSMSDTAIPTLSTTIEITSTPTTFKAISRTSVPIKASSTPEKESDHSTLKQPTTMLPVTSKQQDSTTQLVSTMETSYHNVDQSSTSVISPKFKNSGFELDSITPDTSNIDYVVTDATTISFVDNESNLPYLEHVHNVAYVSTNENSSHTCRVNIFLIVWLFITPVLFSALF